MDSSSVSDAPSGCFEALVKCFMQAHFIKGKNSEHPLGVFCFYDGLNWSAKNNSD